MRIVNPAIVLITIGVAFYLTSCNNIQSSSASNKEIDTTSFKKDGLWEGVISITQNNGEPKYCRLIGEVKNGNLINGELINSDFKDNLIVFKPAIATNQKVLLAKYQGYDLEIHLNDFIRSTEISDKSVEWVTIKISNGKRAGKLYLNFKDPKQKTELDCECEVYNGKVRSLSIIPLSGFESNNKPVYFNPEVALNQNEAEIVYNNLPSKIELKYYDSERSDYKGSNKVYPANEDDPLAKNDICPKCGKKEKDAGIYWCSKCRSLKCPECGENVRTSILKKMCSECERKQKLFNNN